MQSDMGKLFVGGISWDTNEERLKEYFSAYGDVIETVIMKDRATGRARGFGFVVFSDPAVAERVIKEKHSIDGRMVEAKKAVPRDDQAILTRTNTSIPGSPVQGRTRKIFVGGLASTVTESDFKMYFEQFGTITDVVVMYDHNTQRPRGFGFITYDSEDAVDRVLVKTFHELNGKMVEIKRAVPKELSPSPARSPLGIFTGYSGINRAAFLNGGYNQGYNPTGIGGFGVRTMDGRLRSAFAPFGSSYGLGLNFEPGLSSGFNSNNIGFGHDLNPYYIGGSNRLGANSLGYAGGGNEGSTSLFSRNLWGNGGLSYGTNSISSGGFVGSTSGPIGGPTFGSSRVNWGCSQIMGQGGSVNESINRGNISFGNGDNNAYGGLEIGGYGRNLGNSVTQASSYANGGYEGGLGGSVFRDSTWRSENSEQDGPGLFGLGLGNVGVEISAKTSPGYVGGYTSANRQSSRENMGFS